MQLNLIDILVIVIYFIIILYTGFVLANKNKGDANDKDDFILAGRKLTLPFFVASLVATWYGGILGVGEFVYNSGIVTWICFGLPYYIAAGFFAYFLAGKIRNSNVSSIPEQIRNSYGNFAGIVASIIVLIITIPAAYLLMLGIIIELFSGWSLAISIIVGAVVSLIYLYTGGFRADVYTNTAQFILMYVGFAVLLIFSISHFGSIGDMLGELPANHKTISGGNSWQYIFTWFIIAFQTFIDPSFHQRCSAAKSPKIAKNGILISIFLWAIFDFMTLTTGLFARAYIEINNPLMSYPILADMVLPNFWKGIFIVSLLATIMSTLDSYAFISAITIGKDILQSIKRFSHKSEQSLTKVGLIISAIVAIFIAIELPSAVEIIFNTASIAVPGLIFPLTISMSRKYMLSAKHSIIIMIFSSSSSLIWTILKNYDVKIFIDYEPMLIGIFVALVLTILFIKKNILR